ncbi:cytochrome c biogenesis protein ResB [Burkholderia pseudomallei]|uniref:cytochrome c biogenesis protein ResB n=1 Tax=Burkholderia pseudomallei TaxID=28450 RepID=UPI0009C6201E|nr:cytochrome c biogenesis protein ResB [Burkholderia pseudomallei]MBD2920328.1 cytochrome c biogenesis protein ResB [Burkholderia pseudomallei]MBD2999989.1 cytochrome c biogenesis protein ResB [Burkholderia pseudomallei]OMR42724.1 cytochrome C biogenesis protein ResB [Burkholderia pseudomallei]OMT03202.1 cytochrome C biogenesis protein ResB [Burkholderia pseudomallei]ONF35259.1 cytochrome C biogenesis protein ResB [Burkholderia pseudomallei]
MSVTTSGLQSRTGPSAVRRAVELLSSMRFAIALLVVLSIASIIGTVLTQDDPYPNYVNQFGPFWADIFRSLSLYTVYSAWWFMLILIFLVVSISLCVIRNAPKMLADAKSWKDKVREGSLRAFHHKAEFAVAGDRARATQTVAAFVAKAGYRHVVREAGGATLVAAKRGAMTKFGYIAAHLAIVVICVGGLLDSNLPIKFQMWMFGKSPVNTSATISEIGAEHRLSASNPTFRGYAWVPEGQYVSTAILNQPTGSLIQDLPFSIQLEKFIVDYYSTGMPKLFASDIVVVDRETGKRIPARVEVNKPFTYKGVSIYQSSFQDGGSLMEMTAYPMTGASAATFPFKGTIGNSVPLAAAGADDETVEFSDFRAINVENVTDANGKTDARGVAANRSIKELFDARLGSGAKTSKPVELHNIGPSVQYKVRGKDGQAREFNNYMLPVDMGGERVFLAGVRASPNDPFRYLRIPADSRDSVGEWMRLRAALEDPAVRIEAARRFARHSLGTGDAALRDRLEDSAQRVLTLFAGADGSIGRGADGNPIGGFQSVATFIDRSVPKDEKEKAAALLLRMLEGSMWEVWQIARERAGEPPVQQAQDTVRFVQNAINALSDSFLYGAPVYLQLDSFKQVQASVFQLTRAPGKNLVYLGSLLLVAGIFAMFYVRERRLWFWLKDTGAGVSVLMAMSTARKTFDFEKEFVQTRDAAGAALGAPAFRAPDGAGTKDSTR